MRLELLFAGAHLGYVEDPFVADGIWYGTFVPASSPQLSAIQQRAFEYIHFCADLYGRIDAGEEPDPGELAQFADVLLSGGWELLPVPEGSRHTVSEAPIFLENEISWRED